MNIINVVLSGIISCIATVLIIKNLSDYNIKKSEFLIFSLLFFPCMILNVLYISGVYRLIISIIIISSASYFSLFNKNISDAVYYTLAYELFSFLGEIIISFIFVSILRFDLNNYESFSFSLLIFSICNCLLIFVLSKIPVINKSVRKLNKIISKNNKDWIYIFIIIVLMILLMTFNRYNLASNINFYINIGMVIFIVISLIYVIYNKFQKDNIEEKYKNMMEYVERYEKIINEQGKKNHEYNNQLMVLKGYLNKPDKIKEYLDLLIDEHKTGQNYKVKQLGYLPDGGIKGLIYHKLGRMEEYKIASYLYIDQNIKDVFEDKFDIKTYQDITKLLGVFIDNAIEAAAESEAKEIDIEIKKQVDCIIININNTYDTKVDISKIGKKGFSTKGVGHGFGLSIVKDISRNNDNIETFSEKENDKFKQTAIVYYCK